MRALRGIRRGEWPRFAQRGSALMGALFLIVVVGALGAFAVRLQAVQQQTATLQLLGYRAEAAANAGLEYLTHRAANLAIPNCPTESARRLVPLQNHPGLSQFRAEVWCERIADQNGNFVYLISSEGRNTATYGSPDFVRRRLHRTVAVPTSVTATPTPGVYE